jgi:ankyrin repeat protein
MKKLLIIIGVTVGLNTSIVAGPIHDAATSGDLKSVQEELDKGVDVNVKDEYGRTPLHKAATHGHGRVAVVLITMGANVNVKNNDGWTPLLRAVARSHKEIAELLIENGADVNAKLNAGYKLNAETSLHLAVGNIDIVELLITSGADLNPKSSIDLNSKDQIGATPLDHALSKSDYNTTADLLRKHGARTGQEDIAYQFESLKTRIAELETFVSETHKDTTNPTDEWPRKMWEADLGENVTVLQPVLIGNDETSLLLFGSKKWFWASGDGKLIEIPYIGKISRQLSKVIPHIHYFDSDNLVISNFGNTSVILYSRLGDEIIEKKHDSLKVRFPEATSKEIPNTSHIGIIKKAGTNKFICWDFRPPSSTSPAPDGGNNGGNETANSRIIIKTAGPDIALATDGTLGAAELQKSNDLRSWRKLGDVPAEAAEVLVTPRESGNEFYRLKKN